MQTEPMTHKDVVYFLNDLQGQEDASLSVKFDGLATQFTFGGVVDRAKDAKGLAGLTFVGFDPEKDDEEPGLPIVSADLHLDQAQDLTFETTGNETMTLRWSGGGLRLQLDIEVDTAE